MPVRLPRIFYLLLHREGKPRFAKPEALSRSPKPNRSPAKRVRFGNEEPPNAKSFRASARKRQHETRDEFVRLPGIFASAL